MQNHVYVYITISDQRNTFLVASLVGQTKVAAKKVFP